MASPRPGPPRSTGRALRPTSLIAVIGAIACLLPVSSDLLAQGVTTTAIRGTVRAVDGTAVDGARVTVVNAATGFVVAGEVRHGRFLVQGLEVGGPYTIAVRRIGFLPQQRDGAFLTLGEPLELQFVLQPVAIPLDPIRVAVHPFPRANAHGGTATAISDSLLHRLPALNRNLYDFVGLAPQISTKIGFAAGGMSGGGVGFRFNNFLINGVPQRSVPGGQPPEFAGGRSVPFEAVSEYQILLAPFDVRYGDFAGALVNAVTRSGTNHFQGSVFGYGRNDALARRGELGSSASYERLQYGFSVGGPVWRDRVHFFVAPELQHLTSAAPGPYVGQPAAATEPVPVSEADLARLEQILGSNGLVAGSGGPVKNSNPLRSLFARLDVALPRWNSRAVVWVNDMRSRDLDFSRAARDLFPLSTNQATQAAEGRTTALQLHTALRRAGGGHNELLLSHRSAGSDWRVVVQQPIVRVAVPSTTGGAVTVVSGTPPQAQEQFLGSRSINLRDNLSLPLGASHLATLGFEAEWFRAERGGVLNAFGTWTFASLDSLALGAADRFEVSRDFGSASVPLSGGHYAAYAGDQWRAGERVSLTMGLRAELLVIHGRPPYHPLVDQIFARRTDATPRRRVQLSPRLGFTWDLSGTGRDQLRGGVGVFTGRPPLAWIHSAHYAYGVGIGALRCGRLPADQGPPPPFVPDHRTPPEACANGVGFTSAPRGDVDLLDSRLRMAQTLRGVLAYDRRLPGDVLGTVEALVTRNISDFVFVNLNLEAPQGVDRQGRVLYGTIGPTGLAQPALRSDFSEVIDLRNTSRNHSYQLSARLEKRFSAGAAATAHYTFSRVRDVQTPLRIYNPAIVNWSSRAVSGRHDDLSPGISLNDIPHRLVLAGTVRAPWRRWSTEFSFYYMGESGGPFTYLAWGAGRRGDLNADGSNANDPVYVPRSALDTTEIRFSGQSALPGADNSAAAQAQRVSSQQGTFEQFIQGTACLRQARGRILARNSCREPWSHTTIASVRQAIPIAGRTLEAQLDVYNVLNLLKSDWGHYRVAAPALLEHVGQTAGPPDAAQPIFRFNSTAPQWTTLPAESAFQLQLALRYRFGSPSRTRSRSKRGSRRRSSKRDPTIMRWTGLPAPPTSERSAMARSSQAKAWSRSPRPAYTMATS